MTTLHDAIAMTSFCPLARQAALGVSFNTLVHSTPDARVYTWGLVKTVADNVTDEHALNQWWRAVMPDARWKTADELARFAEFKIADISAYHGL